MDVPSLVASNSPVASWHPTERNLAVQKMLPHSGGRSRDLVHADGLVQAPQAVTNAFRGLLVAIQGLRDAAVDAEGAEIGIAGVDRLAAEAELSRGCERHEEPGNRLGVLVDGIEADAWVIDQAERLGQRQDVGPLVLLDAEEGLTVAFLKVDIVVARIAAVQDGVQLGKAERDAAGMVQSLIGVARSSLRPLDANPTDPDLGRLIDAWQYLPDHVRRTILMLADRCKVEEDESQF